MPSTGTTRLRSVAAQPTLGADSCPPTALLKSLVTCTRPAAGTEPASSSSTTPTIANPRLATNGWGGLAALKEGEHYEIVQAL